MTDLKHGHPMGTGMAKCLGSVAISAVMMVSGAVAGFAQGAYDTTDPEYLERTAKMVEQGRIREECLPQNAPAPAASWVPIAEPSAELIAAASEEGSIVLNSGISDKPSVAAYIAAFESRYPEVKMTVAAGGSRTFEERFLADHAAGNQPVDAAISNKIAWVTKAFQEEALYSLDETIPGFFDNWPGGSWRWDTELGSTAPAFYRVLGIAYNSDMVAGDMIPSDFIDLTKPEFKDQLLGMDPSASATFARVWKHIWDQVGDDGMRAIGDNMIKNPLYTDIQALAQVLGAGGAMISMEMGLNVANTMQENGAPVTAVVPPISTGTQYVFGVATAAPNPNAAKLFAHWLYSAEGQWVTSCAAFAGTAAYPEMGSAEFVPIDSVSKEDIATMRELLGI